MGPDGRRYVSVENACTEIDASPIRLNPARGDAGHQTLCIPLQWDYPPKVALCLPLSLAFQITTRPGATVVSSRSGITSRISFKSQSRSGNADKSHNFRHPETPQGLSRVSFDQLGSSDTRRHPRLDVPQPSIRREKLSTKRRDNINVPTLFTFPHLAKRNPSRIHKNVLSSHYCRCTLEKTWISSASIWKPPGSRLYWNHCEIGLQLGTRQSPRCPRFLRS